APPTSFSVIVPLIKRGLLMRFRSRHLDSGRDLGNRVVQATELNRVLAHDDGMPAILAGDLNSGLQTEAMQVLGGTWTRVSPDEPPPLVPTGRPGRVDHVLVRPSNGWKVIDASVVDAPIASDHRPVLVVLEWTGHASVVANRH